MSTKHTPGPWQVNRQSGITYIWQAGTENAVAKVYADVNEDSEANARLIAAAPELLAALKDTFDALLREKIAYNQRIGADYETAHKHALLSNDFAAARAAIAKATGNTSADL